MSFRKEDEGVIDWMSKRGKREGGGGEWIHQEESMQIWDGQQADQGVYDDFSKEMA